MRDRLSIDLERLDEHAPRDTCCCISCWAHREGKTVCACGGAAVYRMVVQRHDCFSFGRPSVRYRCAPCVLLASERRLAPLRLAA